MSLHWLLLILLAALIGWYIGKHSQKELTIQSSQRLHHDYFTGLNYLINEQPDKAVDVFIKMLEADTDTVETHLALGNLFRRRGEVDRAIRIHQNLIARPQLAKRDRVHALAELGQDYMRAGVLDRAERLFLELVGMHEEVVPSLRYLLNIYQQQKDWEQAIAIAEKLQANANENMSAVIAHYYCELAEKAREQDNVVQTQRFLKKAQTIDKHCVRASFIQAQVEKSAKNYKAAINYYKRVKQQDPDFISEIVKPLAVCYEQLDRSHDLAEYLYECVNEYPGISVVIALVDHLQKTQGNKAAIIFLEKQIQLHPSLRGLNHLIYLYLATTEKQKQDHLLILYQLVSQLLKTRPIYRCTECGVAAMTLYWQCPGCKNWNTVRPIHGLEGE
jgi:lipopolysaccharide biosynthesis regulator YciM